MSIHASNKILVITSTQSVVTVAKATITQPLHTDQATGVQRRGTEAGRALERTSSLFFMFSVFTQPPPSLFMSTNESSVITAFEDTTSERAHIYPC